MSGIYIPGMEMPKSCAFCPMFDDVYTHFSDDEEYVCKLGVSLNYYQYAGDEPKDCPLISVPDHGRLIDADALPINNPIHSMMVFGGEIVIAKSAIDNMPTIIPEDKDGADDV